jgi:hypothetical protein
MARVLSLTGDVLVTDVLEDLASSDIINVLTVSEDSSGKIQVLGNGMSISSMLILAGYLTSYVNMVTMSEMAVDEEE